MHYLLAISGGIDSVVLLDSLARKGGHKLTVAHFDHGIRPDSAADARFVQALAETYGLPCVTAREELRPGASEELARNRRYAFLRSEAEKHDATIVTAHHGDDVVETIVINLIRGTGWRGLAVLDTPDVVRPLLGMSKDDIRTYARVKGLEWVEDSTNASGHYLRNRVRQAIGTTMNTKSRQEVLELWKRQLRVKVSIDELLAGHIRTDSEYSRHFFIQVDPIVAQELLRAVIVAAGGASPTRPQTQRALLMVKTARPRTVFEVSAGVTLRFQIATFVVQTP